MMEIDLSGLEVRARSSGDAYCSLLSREGARMGLSARLEGRSVVMEVEVQLRLVPPDTDVDLDSLHQVVDALANLSRRGFGLHHFGEGWVVATLPFTADDLPLLAEVVERITQDSN